METGVDVFAFMKGEALAGMSYEVLSSTLIGIVSSSTSGSAALTRIVIFQLEAFLVGELMSVKFNRFADDSSEK